MSFFGLDLGSSSMRIVQAMPMGNSYLLNAVGSTINPVASIDFADPTQNTRASDNLKKLLTEMGIKERRVVVGISETKVYSRVVSMPVMSDAELSSAIMWEAEQFVPVPIIEVEMDYSVVSKPKAGSSETNMLVYLLASPKKYLQSIVDFVVGLGLEPIAIESELIAASRILNLGGLQGTTLILNIGSVATTIGITSGGELSFSYVIPVGGQAMTRALAEGLSFSVAQAEEYKTTYGLDGAQFEGKVKMVLLPIINSITSEMKKAIEYHSVQRKTQVVRIIVSGGGAYLPSISTYLSSEFQGMEVVTSDPFAHSKLARGVVLPKDKATYTVATGLSLREF